MYLKTRNCQLNEKNRHLQISPLMNENCFTSSFAIKLSMNDLSLPPSQHRLRLNKLKDSNFQNCSKF